MKPSTQEGGIRRVVVRFALLVGSAAAFWLLTAAPVSALDASPVEEALETGIETVEDAAGRATRATATVAEDVERAAPVRDAVRTAVDLVRTATISVVAVAEAATLADAEPPAVTRDDDEGGRVVARDARVGRALAVRSTPVSTDFAEASTAPVPAGESRHRATSTSGELGRRDAAGTMPAPCPARDPSPPRQGPDDPSGFLLALTTFLGAGRWSRPTSEVRITPAFLSLTERPG
jgi:hypothetical protein